MSEHDDRLMESFRALVRAELANLTFLGTYEYSVTETQEDGDVVTFDGMPTTTSFPLPPAVKWPLRPGVAGARCVPSAGDRVLVTFVNADPTRPVGVSFDSSASDSIKLQAGTTGASPTEHATSTEAVVNMLFQLLPLLPVTVGSPGSISAGAAATAINAMLLAAVLGDTTLFDTNITGAMIAKLPNATGFVPGIGWPDVKGG